MVLKLCAFGYNAYMAVFTNRMDAVLACGGLLGAIIILIFDWVS